MMNTFKRTQAHSLLSDISHVKISSNVWSFQLLVRLFVVQINNANTLV